MASGEFGVLYPREVIQEDTRACLSACILTQLDPASGVTEQDISRVLIADGIYVEGEGTGLFPASVLDQSLQKFGLKASPVYGARAEGPDQDQQVVARLSAIEQAIKAEESVIVAFPKRREGQLPFLHYAVITGYREDDDDPEVIGVDPSDVDGGIEQLSYDQMVQHVTPELGYPVMAWGVSQQSKAANQPVTSVTHMANSAFDLLTHPIHEATDLGIAIPPGTEHPTSVAMTTSDISKQFNHLGGVVLSRDGELPVGYPRFVIPKQVRLLSAQALGNYNGLPFPTMETAEASAHLERTYKTLQARVPGSKDIEEKDGLFWLKGTQWNEEGWQNAGLGISSRQAQANLEGRPDNDLEKRAAAEATIKKVIGEHTGADSDDIYLFPTGMAAMYWANQALIKSSDGLPAAQFGFPYTDTYDQRKFGPNRSISQNIQDFRDGDYQRLADTVGAGQGFRAVMTEIPSNPLLMTPDLSRLDTTLGGETPLVVDDTIASVYNIDDSKLPDSVVARVTSLTKYFSSVGDVMGGSIVLRPGSPHYTELKAALDEIYVDTLWYEDAETLAKNSELFPAVMPDINNNGQEVAQWLDAEWTGDNGPLETVYHPSVTGTAEYDAVKKDGAGYSGLMSLKFKDPDTAFRFFDHLKVTKGPSLGTYYTLGCLYTLLAHKNVESVERFGVAPDLVRLSVGIEPADELKDRMVEARDKA